MTLAAAVVMAVTSLGLLIFGLNLLYLSFRSLRLPPPSSGLVAAGREATVCVQLPIYNERHVAERVLDAACRLDWPRDRFEIQVLDDSDDDTSAIVARAVARWRRRGVRVAHVRRGTRAGYKAGALAHGLTLTDAGFLAVFDADFAPPPDFLRRMLDAFDDPRIAFVQARWGHLNEGYSLFTRLQGMAIDYHFLVEQAVRFGSGFLANFNGTAGVWRRAAIEDAGGWSAATLTEDLDISYRALLKGWKAAYREAVVVPEELPVAVPAFRRQQARWATGSFQCARRHIGPVLRSRLGVAVKWQAMMHLLAYGVGILMLLQLLCAPLLLWAEAVRDPMLVRLTGPVGSAGALVPMVGVMGLAPTVACAIAQARRGRRWWYGLVGLPGQLLGAAMMLTVLVAFFRALRPGGVFERTPKHRIVAAGEEWRDSAYVRAWDPTAGLEAVVGLAAAASAIEALRLGLWPVALYSALFAAGLLTIATWSLLQSLQVVTLRAFGRTALRGLSAAGRMLALLLLPAVLLTGVALIGDPFEDSYHHWLVAATLAATGQLRDPLFGMEDTWLPAYHFLAAAALKVFGLHALGALKAVNIGLGLATLALVHGLAGDPRRGRLAVLLLALNPIFWITATSVAAEPLLTLLLVAAAAGVLAGQTRLAAVLAALACLTGTKAWIWLLAAAAIPLAERWLAPSRRRTALRWAIPALALLAVLQLGFEPATHSAARAAAESASAVSRGSVGGDPVGRLLAFFGYFTLASLPLLVLAPLGVVAELRSGGADRLRLLHLPAGLYLAAVAAMVTAGLYTGSHRYYYPALPALALLAAAALAPPQTVERGKNQVPASMRRLRPAGAALTIAAAGLVAVAFLPVAMGFAAQNSGLEAAGSIAGRVPGRLFTDSPAAAYSSGKAPADIVGAQGLPADPALAVDWLRARGVTSVVVEDIDYYRAATVFPGLARGDPEPPFAGLGDQVAYQVPGGKTVHAYTLDTYHGILNPGLDLSLSGRPGGPGKTSQLHKGVALDRGGSQLVGEGMGFGVPVVHYGDGWHYAGSAVTVDLSAPDQVVWRKTFELDRMEQYDSATGLKSYRAVPSRGRVEVTYTIGRDQVHIAVRALDLAPGYQQVVLLNEQSAAFNDFADPTQTRIGSDFGHWMPATGSWARLRSPALGLEWSVPAIPGATIQAGRELEPPLLDWAGLDYLFGPGFSGTEYTVTVGRAR